MDQRLDKIGSERPTALRGQAAIANAWLAYHHHERTLANGRWRALERAGARPQRPLWASTGAKNPAYPDTRYVVDLVASGVVNTMPEATFDAVADHGHVPVDSIHGTYEAAEQLLADLAELGVDYDDVMRVPETDGIEKFDASWDVLGRALLPMLMAPRA